MKPVKGVSVWNPLQQHAAQTFLEKTSIFFLAYEMPRRWGKTTLLEDLIVKAFFEEREVKILLISQTSAEKCHSSNRINNLTREKAHYSDPLLHVYETIHTRVYCIDLRFDVPRGWGGEWIFIDDCNDMEPEYFFKHLVPLFQLAQCRVFWPFSGKEPFPMQYLKKHCTQIEVNTFFLDYPSATRRAIHAWIMCARRMGVHRNIVPLIAQWVEATRHDTCWLNLEYQ